jgi:hypothetical protein
MSGERPKAYQLRKVTVHLDREPGVRSREARTCLAIQSGVAVEAPLDSNGASEGGIPLKRSCLRSRGVPVEDTGRGVPSVAKQIRWRNAE